MDDPHCWFLSFLWRGSGDAAWKPADATTRGEHPLIYIMRARAAYPQHQYHLVFFQVIPDDVYEFYRGS